MKQTNLDKIQQNKTKIQNSKSLKLNIKTLNRPKKHFLAVRNNDLLRFL